MQTETTTQYLLAHKDVIEARTALAEEDRRHAAAVQTYQAALADAQRRVNVGDSGLDLERVELARTVLLMRGSYARGGEARAAAVRDAIADLVSGPTKMRTDSFGTKDYDRWSGQRCDCRYGYGPSHGHIVFEIGLLPDARARDLSEAERDAAVYYLANIERVEAATGSAATP